MFAFDGSTFDLGSLTATSILGWYAWHTTTHAMPELVRAFRDEVNAIRAECAAERESLQTELSAERDQRHEHYLLVVDALRELGKKLTVDGGR